jgi:hypothetical protein
MPRRSKGPRLWLQPARKNGKGNVIEQAVWVIREGSTKRSTGCGPGEIEQATAALRDYLNAKPTERPRDRDPSSVAIADVVAIYTEDVVSKHRSQDAKNQLEQILHQAASLSRLFSASMLNQIFGTHKDLFKLILGLLA